MVARSHREMQWTEGWANEDALLSALDRRTGEALVSPLERSFSEDESSVAPSHEMDDTDDGLKELLYRFEWEQRPGEPVEPLEIK